jgi:hypothetical protein
VVYFFPTELLLCFECVFDINCQPKSPDSTAWVLCDEQSDGSLTSPSADAHDDTAVSNQAHRLATLPKLVFRDFWPLLLELLPILSEVRMTVGGTHLRILLRLLLDSAVRVQTPSHVRQVVEVLSMLQFVIEKLAGNGQETVAVPADSADSVETPVPFSFNDCALYAVQRLCSLKFQVDRIMANTAPSVTVTSVESQLIQYASQAVLRVAQSIVDTTGLFAFVPSNTFRLQPGTTYDSALLASIPEAHTEKFQGSFAEWQYQQLQTMVDSKIIQCRRLPLTMSSEATLGFGPATGKFAIALPVSVDDDAQVLSKIIFSDFPDVDALVFDNLLMYMNHRIRNMASHEMQRQGNAQVVADQEAMRFRKKWSLESDIRSTQLSEFTKKSTGLHQKACFGEINRRAVSTTATQAAVDFAGDLWRKIQEMLCEDPSPWHDVPLGRALGLSLTVLNGNRTGTMERLSHETRFQWKVDRTEDEFRMRRKLKRQLVVDTEPLLPHDSLAGPVLSNSVPATPVDSPKLSGALSKSISQFRGTASQAEDDAAWEVVEDTTVAQGDALDTSTDGGYILPPTGSVAAASSTASTTATTAAAGTSAVPAVASTAATSSTSTRATVSTPVAAPSVVTAPSPASAPASGSASIVSLPDCILTVQCTLILPVDTLTGTLEISNRWLHFSVNSSFVPASERNIAAGICEAHTVFL